MERISHGEALPTTFEEQPLEVGESLRGYVAVPLTDAAEPWPCGFMFPKLAQDDLAILPVNDGKTVDALTRLSQPEIMGDAPLEIPGVPVPTAYTFFGQFVDHDITHEKGTEKENLSVADLQPLAYLKILELQNARSPNLELDSVYGSVSGFKPPTEPGNPDKLVVARVIDGSGFPEHCDNPKEDVFNDLPRAKPNCNPRRDRVALIGDVRNDENIITAQLHVAFLRAHNRLVDPGPDGPKRSFDDARRLLIKHYQWIVLNDFLPRITNPAILHEIRTEGPKFYQPTSRKTLFTPLEFSVAAYRFGHSKIRQTYRRYNSKQPSAQLDQLFTFSRFGGPLGSVANALQIPDSWIIHWKFFLNPDEPNFFSRPIDTRLTAKLFDLMREQGVRLEEWKKNLVLRNLLRGYYLRIPTGQAVAAAMQKKMPEIIPLTPAQIGSAIPSRQYDILQEAQLLERTPLWFYILAEAQVDNCGKHLGPVGSVIVAETLIGMLRHSEESIWPWPKEGEANLPEPNWTPHLGQTPDQFTLEDLLRFAQVYRP
jgi:hypothetical protein